MRGASSTGGEGATGVMSMQRGWLCNRCGWFSTNRNCLGFGEVDGCMKCERNEEPTKEKLKQWADRHERNGARALSGKLADNRLD